MPLSIKEMKDKIDLVRFNPTAICQVALDILEEVNSGNRLIVDPTNPFMFLLEASAVNASAAMSCFADYSRKQYCVMAQDEDEIYMHMSDRDFLGRFGNPSRTSMVMLLSLEEVYAKALPTGIPQMKKVVIPRHTTFTVAGYSFMMQYPIELRVMSHGGLNVIHDVSKQSPFLLLESNVVEHEIVNIDGTVFVCLHIPVLQLESQVHYPKVNSGILTEATYRFSGQFYYARVYRSLADGTWDELRTTHSEQVFDINRPTAVLKVYRDSVKVSIPLAYQVSGQVSNELRVEIYTTSGEISLILNNYPPNAYQATWLDYDNDDQGLYSAPLKAFNAISVYSEATVSGGSNSMDFDTVRERLISTSLGDQQLPITNLHLKTNLTDAGFNMVANLDFLTNRQFLATRTLPIPEDRSFYTGMASTMGTLQGSLLDLRNLHGVTDNDRRITLTPKVLYKNDDSILTVIHSQAIENIEAKRSTDLFVNEVSGKNYLWSPFYYVLDVNDDYFNTRAYHLDNPSISSKTFVEENAGLGLVIGTENYDIEKIPAGYRLVITTKSGKAYKELSQSQRHVVLSFEAPEENGRASLLGTLIYTDPDTDECSYEFLIETNYDIDSNHNLVVENFTIFGSVQKCTLRLKDKFSLVYGVTDYLYQGMALSPIDSLTDSSVVPAGHFGVIHEELNFVLGHSMDSLWTNSRSVVGTEGYHTYETDVPSTYTSTVYKRDPLTGAYLITVVDDEPVFEVLHEIGDIVTVGGTTQYKHRKGDLVLDSQGQPIVTSPRNVQRQVDLFLVDGLFYFADAETTRAYTNSIPDLLVGWLHNDISRLSENLLEITELFYYPQRTTGYVDALVLEGFEIRLEVEQKLKIELYMTKNGYEDHPLRKSIETSILEILASEFTNQTVRSIDIENRIIASAKDQVITASVSGLGGNGDYRVVSITDDSARFGIRKKLQALADGTYSVTDDVTIVFLKHTNS